MRHFPFPIGPLQRERWLVHMTAAVEGNTPEGEIRDALGRNALKWHPGAESGNVVAIRPPA